MSSDAKVMFACLAAACGVSAWAWRDSTRLLDVPYLILLASLYILFAALAAALVFVLLGRSSRCLRHLFFSAVGSAALLPGTVLLVQRHSVWAVVPAAAIAWLVASALRVHKQRPDPPSGLVPRMSPLSPVAGGFVQMVIVLLALGKLTLAVLAVGVATWTLMAVPGAVPFVPRSGRCVEMRGTGRKWLLVFANAFTLTCFALLPHVWGSRQSATEIPQTAAAEQYRERMANPNAPPDDDVHQGIIIYPEEEKHVVLVPPVPSMRAMGAGTASDPLSIPFFGVYWVFRPPYRRPPPKSLVLRADPAKRNLHSNDGRSLNMEARQNFGTYFDPACCRALQVIGLSNDSQPGGVGVELFVRDSAEEKAAPSFVGRLPLGADARVNLRFEFPDHLRRFDEVIVSYKLAVWRRDRAPKVSIERFVFEPRVP